MGMQMRKLINIDDLSVIYDELHRCGVLEEYQTAEFHKQAKDYVKQAKKIVEGDYQIEKDEEGYYETDTPEREVWVNAIYENLQNKNIDVKLYLGNEIYMSNNIIKLVFSQSNR